MVEVVCSVDAFSPRQEFGLDLVVRRSFLEVVPQRNETYCAITDTATERKRIQSDSIVNYEFGGLLVPDSWKMEDRAAWADLEDSPMSRGSEPVEFPDMLPGGLKFEEYEDEIADSSSSKFFENDAKDAKVAAVPQLPPGVWQPTRPQGVWQAEKEKSATSGVKAATEHSPVGTQPRRRAPPCPVSGPTTVVIRNFPHTYTRDMVCELMNEAGFQGRYDFVYLPVDFISWMAFGYAFVNMNTHNDALNIMEKLNGFTEWKAPGNKACDVVWSDPFQGLEANIERYRNSPVMGPTVDERYKPLLFVDGQRVAFPSPTKKLNPPRVRRSSQYSAIRASIEEN